MNQRERDLLYKNIITQIAKMVKSEILKNIVSLRIKLMSDNESISLCVLGSNLEEAVSLLWILQQASLSQPGGPFVIFEMNDIIKRQLRIFNAGLTDESRDSLYAVAEDLGFKFSNVESLLEIVARLRATYPDNLRVC